MHITKKMLYKCKRKPKVQIKMNNPEEMVTLGTQATG